MNRAWKQFSNRRTRWAATVLALACLFAPATSAPQEKMADEVAAKLDAYLTIVMEKFEIPGLTIAVTEREQVVYTRAFGVRDLDTREPMKPDYFFHMASVSKPFVATAIVQLVEQGKIDLDAPITTYLPYFSLADERYKKITVRQMLNHTSGMPDVQDYEWDKPQYDDGAAERYVRSLKAEQMIAAPGERWRYSNMAFDTMGDLIAKVSGKPFETYVKDHILNPLGMTHSSFLRNEIPNELRTSPHVWKQRPVVSLVYPYNRRHAPSSTLNSSVLEMANWAFANLNHGELNGKRILRRESYDLLWQASAEVDDETKVGLSWFLGSYRDNRTVSHSGGDTGYRSHCTLLPEKKIGVLLAANYDQTPMGSIRNGVLDVVLGHEPSVPKQRVTFAFAKVYLAKGLEAAKAHYRELERSARDEYLFGDGQLNRLGYYFLGENQVRQAIEVFRFNVELYPEVANTYDSLGEAYMKADQKDKAIFNYEKSLELDPSNTNAVKMLEKLKEKS